jgi:twitching motility protein PilT
MKLEDLLLLMIERKASDLHLNVGQPPLLRINGELAFTDYDILTNNVIQELAYSVLTPEQVKYFEQTREFDASFGLKDISRFRINLSYQRGTISVALRQIAYEVPDMPELGLPPILKHFAETPSGLFLVTGPAGSGKSTTMASMIEYINHTRKLRIITIEDPIEYLYKHKKSTITQRELGSDTLTFAAALKHVFRQDPNIVLVGEIRDIETMQAVLTLAETGHLVLSTLHTRSATNAISRIIDAFPSHQQQQIRVQLSMVLVGVIVQQLIPRKDGKGRALAYELMNVSPPIRNLIRENVLPQIYSYLQTGGETGMITMNQNLAQLFKKGLVTQEEIFKRTTDLKELKSLL